MRAKIILATIGLFILGGFYWLATHAYIEFSVPSGDATFSLTKQGSQTAVSGKASNKKVRRLVRRGSYEALIQNGHDSYFAVTSTGGFLATYQLKPTLRADNARTFVGDEPNTCLYAVGDSLLSSPCGDAFDQLKVHAPATANQPTVAQKPAANVDGFIEGSFRSGPAVYLVIKQAASDSDSGGHYLYQLGADGSLSTPRQLTELSNDSNYTITSYLAGFIALDTNHTNVFAFDGPSVAGVQINPNEKPKTAKAVLAEVSTYGSSVGYVYTDSPDITAPSFDTLEGEKAHSDNFENDTRENRTPKTEVLIKGDGEVRHYMFRVPAIGVYLCGTDRLCTLDDGNFDVFDISKAKVKKLYSVTRVDAVKVLANSVLLARDQEILSLNVASRSAYISYQFGSYTFCGFEEAENGYVLCAIEEHGKRVALLINLTQPNTDDIDKKITELGDSPYISSISIYKNFINILPSVGDPEPDPNTGYYAYDPAKIQAANTDINERVVKLGIDRTKYSVVSAIQ